MEKMSNSQIDTKTYSKNTCKSVFPLLVINRKGKIMAYLSSFELLQCWWGAPILACDSLILCLSGLMLYLKYPHSSIGTCINKQETGWGNAVSYERSSFVYKANSFLSVLSLHRVGDGMEMQTHRQTQEKTASLISILLSAVINYFIIIHFLYSQEMFPGCLYYEYLIQFFHKPNNLCRRSSEQIQRGKCQLFWFAKS